MAYNSATGQVPDTQRLMNVKLIVQLFSCTMRLPCEIIVQKKPPFGGYISEVNPMATATSMMIIVIT